MFSSNRSEIRKVMFYDAEKEEAEELRKKELEVLLPPPVVLDDDDEDFDLEELTEPITE